MTFTSKPKRKNDDPPRFPAWVVVVVAIGLVIVAFLLFRPAPRNDTGVAIPTPENIEATASAIIQQATAGVQSSDADPLLLTATALIEEATQGAANPDLDPFALTATALVQEVTEMASTPAP